MSNFGEIFIKVDINYLKSKHCLSRHVWVKNVMISYKKKFGFFHMKWVISTKNFIVRFWPKYGLISIICKKSKHCLSHVWVENLTMSFKLKFEFFNIEIIISTMYEPNFIHAPLRTLLPSKSLLYFKGLCLYETRQKNL